MSVKCIALDMDRTTLNAQGMLSEENRKAICFAIENGVHVVIASGRAFSSLPGEVTGIPGIEYAVTCNGGISISGTSRLITDVYIQAVPKDESRYQASAAKPEENP